MYVKQGEYMIIVGPVSGRDARYKEFDSGASVADFSVRYDKDPGGEVGAKQGKYIDVKCWRELSQYARYLERGDVVMVAGKLTRDKRKNDDGNDRWYLNAEFVSAQPQIAEEEEGSVFDENVPDDDPLPESFAKTNAPDEDDYPEALR